MALVVERGGRRQVNREEEREEAQITSRTFEKVTRNHIIFIYLSSHVSMHTHSTKLCTNWVDNAPQRVIGHPTKSQHQT